MRGVFIQHTLTLTLSRKRERGLRRGLFLLFYGDPMSTSIIIFILIALVVFWFVKTYNKLIHMIEAVNNNNKQIDIQLDRRYKVFESLINVVKNYMDYEKTTLKDVVA